MDFKYLQFILVITSNRFCISEIKIPTDARATRGIFNLDWKFIADARATQGIKPNQKIKHIKLK